MSVLGQKTATRLIFERPDVRSRLVTDTLPDQSAAPHAERPSRQRVRSNAVGCTNRGSDFSYASKSRSHSLYGAGRDRRRVARAAI